MESVIDHPIERMVREDNHGFIFGLWKSCPENTPVAWGARAIVSMSGGGFDLIGDRQTWHGPPELRKVFSKLINQGPLKRAIEETKRLRDGWTPFKDLPERGFRDYWYKRLQKEPKLFESFLASSGGYTLESPGYPLAEIPKDCRPEMVWSKCRREQERIDEADAEFQRMDEAGEGFAMPDPPSACESGDDEDWSEENIEDCDQSFKKVRGEWQGGYVDGDAWVCDNCGYHHYFDEESAEDDPWTAPPARVQKAFRKIVGPQWGKMKTNEEGLFTLFDDGVISILGNTNASCGYLYVIAFPKHDAVVESKMVEEYVKEGGVVWSGVRPIPQPGDKVRILSHDIGLATVIAHRVKHDHLHLITVPEGKLPEWWHEQNDDRFFPPARTWSVLGREISSEVIRAGKDS
jgi:hypothetical protein